MYHIQYSVLWCTVMYFGVGHAPFVQDRLELVNGDNIDNDNDNLYAVNYCAANLMSLYIYQPHIIYHG